MRAHDYGYCVTNHYGDMLCAMSNPTERARERLQSRKGQYRAICALSGLGYSWLSKFSIGIISDPGVNRLLKLERALNELDASETLAFRSQDIDTEEAASVR